MFSTSCILSIVEVKAKLIFGHAGAPYVQNLLRLCVRSLINYLYSPNETSKLLLLLLKEVGNARLGESD